jgi:hypothetical protein
VSEYDVVLPESGDDEVMSSGGLPRWLGFVAALAVAALLATLVRQGLAGGGHTAAPAPTASATTEPPGPGPGVAFDLARDSHGTWLLETTRLAQVSGTRVSRSASLHLRVPARSIPVLTVDDTTNLVWVALANAAPSRLVAYDTTTMHKVRDVTWPQLIQGAAAYRGHLYLSTDFGVADLAPGTGTPRFIPGLAGAIGPIAVDAARNRLLAIDFGYPTVVWSYRPGSRPTQSPHLLPLIRGTIAVVDDAIWVAGFGTRHAEFTRLDPRTLRPVASAPTADFGSGAIIIGSGSQVLWMRAGSNGNLLACVDAASGRVEQRWRVIDVNAVASDRSGALVATPSGVLGLVLSGCVG